MEEPVQRKFGTPLSEKEAEQHFRLREMLFEFSKLFDYNEASDRAVAIVGPAFLDTLITELLVSFLIDDKKEVQKLLQPDGPLGSFGAKVTACYCLGLIGETIRSDPIFGLLQRFEIGSHMTYAQPSLTDRSQIGARHFNGTRSRS